MAQSVERPTSAQVMISRSVSSSPALGSVLTAQSLEPASDSVSPFLPLPCSHCVCLSMINKCLKKKENQKSGEETLVQIVKKGINATPFLFYAFTYKII